MVLHEGCISEMGLAKARHLLQHLPAYLNAIFGKRFILSQLMTTWLQRCRMDGKSFFFLGLTVGTSSFRHVWRRKTKSLFCAYTYATNNELGFDYLRDNMAFSRIKKC